MTELQATPDSSKDLEKGEGEAKAKAHDYPLYGFDLTWRDGAYYVSMPNLLKEGERLHVVPVQALTDLGARLQQVEAERDALSGELFAHPKEASMDH